MEDIIETTEDGMVRIIFEKSNGTNEYRDALYFTQENYDATTPEQIETMKQERFDNWIAVITYVAPEETVVVDPLQVELLTEETPAVQESIIQE